jgi:hypothetical protein
MAQDGDAAGAHELQHACNQSNDQQAQAQEQDKQVRHDGRHEKMPPLNRNPVKEDDRHGVLQHRERERAEEQHGDKQKAAHHLAVGQKGPQFLDQRGRLTRHDKLEILPQGQEELVLAEEVREHHQ